MTQSRPDANEEEKKAAEKKAPEIDHQAAAVEKLQSLKMYRAAGIGKKEPEVKADDPGGVILSKLKDFESFKGQDELKGDWAKVTKADPNIDAERTKTFNEAKTLISDHVKQLHAKDEVKNSLAGNDSKPGIDDKFVEKLKNLADPAKTPSTDTEVREAAQRLLKNHETEFAKLHGEHYDAEMKRVDTSLGLQKSFLLAQRAAEDANQYQKWVKLGWFATDEFGARMLQAENEKQMNEKSDLEVTFSNKEDENLKAFQEFRKSPATTYKSTTSPFYMQISGIEYDEDGYVKKCKVRPMLQPGAKDNGKSKQEALSFLAQKTGADAFTIRFGQFEGLTEANYNGRIKDMKEWIAEANKRIPPMEVRFGEGCQEAIDKCRVKGVKDMHIEMEKLLQENRTKVHEYKQKADDVINYEGRVTQYEGEKTKLNTDLSKLDGVVSKPSTALPSADSLRTTTDLKKDVVTPIETELQAINKGYEDLAKLQKTLIKLSVDASKYERDPSALSELKGHVSKIEAMHVQLANRVAAVQQRVGEIEAKGATAPAQLAQFQKERNDLSALEVSIKNKKDTWNTPSNTNPGSKEVFVRQVDVEIRDARSNIAERSKEAPPTGLRK